ncbi:hypothetical protein BCR35DRAFT_302615 [Leucosporidium creatinivorum]|uniref:Zn(2)-C6 fungal-type domain-containing protein n=1 Tax=Leucosporidium creatinivorum TaxID=106004 RepID=A0A1Y2FRR3_9BASI|nr:hypothetical protein BCR35DRAFT_302615 [Leucosporidium creatinivorum]
MSTSEQQPDELQAANASRARPDGTAGPAPAKRRKKAADGDDGAEKQKSGAEKTKKEKACHACRRVKLRCVVEPGSESCKRCSSRNEECVFTTPLHDLKWQQTITARVDHLGGTLDWLVAAVGTIANHLKLDVGAPPVAPPAATASLPSMATPPPPSAPSVLRPLPAEAEQNPSRRPSLVKKPEAVQQLSEPPLPRREPPAPEIDIYTQEGAEQLLAQAYANFSPTFANPLDGSFGSAEYTSSGLPSGAHGPRNALDYVPEAPSFFGLLDFPFASPELNTRPLEEIGASDPTRPMAARLLGSANLDAVGSSDPRTDVVKTGLVSPGDAEVLLDFFHAHLAPHFLGFPLQLRSWPYLPAGKSTITPLILGSICLVSAERIPAYHETVSRLVASDLGESILNATAGLSWAPPKDGDKGETRGREGAAGGEEPDLDLELGIGPEEISALLIYASFSSSPRSDAIARCAFEWTRGYLKTFMLPSPPPVTYGEVFGLLPARRDLTFENWLRLWLFGYIVDVQQSLHHETRAPVFDPNYFCDTLLLSSLSSTDAAEQQRDRELVAHARLCALLQRIQYTRMSAGWGQSTAQELIQAYEGWNTDLCDWWTAQNFHPLPSFTSAPPTSPTLQPDIALTLFRLFASIYVNLAAAKEARLADDAARWRFRARSVGAAYEMLGVVGDEGAARVVNVLFPFYVKMISLAAVVLLDAYRDSVFIGLPCTLEQGIDAVARVAENLSKAPVPSTHVCFAASNNLRKLVSKTEQALKRA